MSSTFLKKISVHDLIVLSLIAEKPMHGYELNATLESRAVTDWAAISRPQVYYSLNKLHEGGFLSSESDQTIGPQKQIFKLTKKGKEALEDGLRESHWSEGRERPAFLTWLALSSHISPKDRLEVIHRRREYLRQQVEQEKGQLKDVMGEEGEMVPAAQLMISFMISSFRLELEWLEQVEAKMS